MRILYAGNLANVGYYHVKQLRQMNIDMELLMERNPKLTADPLKRDPFLTSYPHWIRFYDRQRSMWQIRIIKMMRESKYNLIHAHAELPIFSLFSGKPFLAQALGSDLSVMAFTNSLRGMLLRIAYKKAKVVLFSTPDQPPLLARLGITNSIFLPLISDFSFFRSQKIIDDRFKDKLVIFHPTSHIWDVKGNDILIKAFEIFSKKNHDSILIMVEWGKDLEKSKELVKILGIDDKVLFLKQLDSKDLRHYYNICDIVADQFIDPGIGAIGMETLSCEKPLIIKCSDDSYSELYPEPIPVLDASTSNEICEKLEYLIDEKVRFYIGKKGKEWADRYLSPTSVGRKVITIYEAVLNGDKIEEIRGKIRKNK